MLLRGIAAAALPLYDYPQTFVLCVFRLATSYADQKQTSPNRSEREPLGTHQQIRLTTSRGSGLAAVLKRLGAINQHFQRRRQRAAAVERLPRVRRDVTRACAGRAPRSP